MLRVRAAASKPTSIASSDAPSYSAGSASAWKRSLSQASEAFEISSRRKISRLEYSEWIISLSSCLTSAWKPWVSRWVEVVMSWSSGLGARNGRQAPSL